MKINYVGNMTQPENYEFVNELGKTLLEKFGITAGGINFYYDSVRKNDGRSFEVLEFYFRILEINEKTIEILSSINRNQHGGEPELIFYEGPYEIDSVMIDKGPIGKGYKFDVYTYDDSAFGQTLNPIISNLLNVLYNLICLNVNSKYGRKKKNDIV